MASMRRAFTDEFKAEAVRPDRPVALGLGEDEGMQRGRTSSMALPDIAPSVLPSCCTRTQACCRA